ncbi:MAG: uroporphyrinogen-III synthase [Bacteroidales bacterium]|mgnify:CR=1 FL=1|jgi:uroporphyrinogen-III synthase|nr:uroporphyrinogen-III synthase [Bacteroidales bacterium]MDD4703427.1 uroporphyrinogen-III synthase [Bacteroidales bacterium]MDX9797742.1 uroporphyrinogen-III synthase [Bacteroidales bacterium]
MSKQIIKNVLISQPAPADIDKSQYKILIDKHNLNFTFYKFFDVVGVTNKEYRDSKVNILDHSAVIVTSKLAVDNYFRLAKELRLVIPESMKFFCVSESIANYLQNYIQYRKRKIFYGKLQFSELISVITKHKNETFLYPCSEETTQDNFKLLEKAKITFTKSVMYRSVPKNLGDIDIKKFDLVVMFSPIGVKSFIQSFKSSEIENIVVAAFGTSTQISLKEAKIRTMIPAPTIEAPSMIMAIDRFLSFTASELEEHKMKIEEEFNRKPEKKVPAALKITTKKNAKSQTEKQKSK